MARAAQAKAFALLLKNGDFICATPCRIFTKTHCVRHFLAGKKNFLDFMLLLANYKDSQNCYNL
jgi:hypothetical protein